MRGNVIDLAVGIIIGGAFGTIVKSLVDDVIMPPIGLALGNVDFADLFMLLKAGAKAAAAVRHACGSAGGGRGHRELRCLRQRGHHLPDRRLRRVSPGARGEPPRAAEGAGCADDQGVSLLPDGRARSAPPAAPIAPLSCASRSATGQSEKRALQYKVLAVTVAFLLYLIHGLSPARSPAPGRSRSTRVRWTTCRSSAARWSEPPRSPPCPAGAASRWVWWRWSPRRSASRAETAVAWVACWVAAAVVACSSAAGRWRPRPAAGARRCSPGRAGGSCSASCRRSRWERC